MCIIFISLIDLIFTFFQKERYPFNPLTRAALLILSPFSFNLQPVDPSLFPDCRHYFLPF